jgi:non-ribosomal peptide synthetase component F
MHKHVAGQPLSIGKPTPNNIVYILDENEDPVPIGKAGIMWGGGKGISRGYIDLPDKTAEKWKYDKFADDGYVTWRNG